MDQHAPSKSPIPLHSCYLSSFFSPSVLNAIPQLPITLCVQLANYTEKPEWNLNGATINVPDIPLTLLVSSLRDRIISHVKANIPASRIRLSFRNKMLTNANTLASYNMDDDDLIVMTLKEARR